MKRAALVLCLASVASGWRGDGTGHEPASLPDAWTPAGPVLWRAALPGPTNATPVTLGRLVCTPFEPNGLACIDATTGALAWSLTTDRIDALPADQQAARRAEVAAVAGKDEALRTLQHDYSRLRTALRRDPTGPAAGQIAEVTGQMAAVRASLDAVAPWRVPPSPATVGWTTPTPVTEGDVVVQVLSFGVVTAVRADGSRLWVRDLGMPSPDRRGHTGPTTASPVIAEGVLVVVHDRLTGLDPQTGAVRWTGPPTPDFGTPAVVRGAGQSWVALPDGSLVDPRTGRVVATGPGHVWYAGPYAVDDVVCWVGSVVDHVTRAPGQAACARVTATASGPGVTPLWSRELPVTDTFYADPVAWGPHLVAVSRHGEAVVLSRDDGAVVRTVDLALPLATEVWASPIVAGDALVVAGDAGDLRVYGDATLTAPRVLQGTATVAAPRFAGDRVYLRTADALTAIGT